MRDLSRRQAAAAALGIVAAAAVPALVSPDPAEAASADPMLTAIRDYVDADRRFHEAARGLTDDECDDLISVIYDPPFYLLQDETPETTTLQGATEALRLLADRRNHLLAGDIGPAILASVVAYFDRLEGGRHAAV